MKTHAELYPGTDPNCPAILAPIEPGVQPLCDALNALPDTYTLWSCEGHPERASEPYITFIAPQEIAFSLHKLTECSPLLKFNWVLTSAFREDGSMQYTLHPSDARLTRQAFSWGSRKQWSHDDMCAELLKLAKLVAQRGVLNVKENKMAINTVMPMCTDYSELFYSSPTNSEAVLNLKFKERLNLLISQIQKEVEDVHELVWWVYRVSPHDCIACDIYGSENSLPLHLTITIAGDTVLPSFPQEESFDLQDATDALCLLNLLVEKFQLKHVKPVSQGLMFSLREIEK